jgi:hypothetical protein
MRYNEVEQMPDEVKAGAFLEKPGSPGFFLSVIQS